MKIITILTAVVLALLANTGHSNAKTAVWERLEHWTIYGNTDTNGCYAETNYVNGKSLGIFFGADDDVTLAIYGVQVSPGEIYGLNVALTSEVYGKLEGIGLTNTAIVFPSLNKAMIQALVNAQAITIDTIGKYQLRGSKAAMASAWSCYEALNSY